MSRDPKKQQNVIHPLRFS